MKHRTENECGQRLEKDCAMITTIATMLDYDTKIPVPQRTNFHTIVVQLDEQPKQ